jgi:hypothetical protein
MSKCRWHKGGSKKYVLDEEYRDRVPFETNEYNIRTPYCTLKCDGTIIIHEGYQWDGASGPTIDTDNTMDGSLVHDVLYQLMREELLPRKYRKGADKCIMQMCITDGMPVCRAYYWYFFLRWFGKGSSK